ncbi:MAG: hypothetical protein A3J07_00185 [Candidatus Doudnabacteria bacterium RIFCSPLOWO2_02_FULL_49_13]|nr:MAG: hypothetical protein A3J07_00185 [Candidatus Doudnabacteria bacterium RIFCSPLOWO2_02_FULL_49_13]OGF03560.1 MAG: hypothetical protein A3H14_03865 [Candidatus Doudnabacteria bacterium RIFCSPLOWO2_12_FULL_49_8]
MATPIIKLGKKDDIASVVKRIKDLREREVIFELESGSALLRSSDNLKLMKRTGEALGKKIRVTTDDEIGKILAKKAGVLLGDLEVKMPKGGIRVARSDVKPRFSDILGGSRIPSRAVGRVVEKANAFAVPKISMPTLPKFNWNFGEHKTVKIFLAALAGLIVVCFALAIWLPKATITLMARSESITRDFEIVVDKTVAQADPDNLEIPGFVVEKEKSKTESFPATGKESVGLKAAGAVTLYNFTNNTLTLKASTTTLVANGQKYKFTHDVTGLKPTQGTQAKPDLASLIPPVPIVADSGGESSNMPPGTKFKVVNAALGNQNVYAINQTAITGGKTTTSATVFSQQDFDNAVASMVNAIVAEAAAEASETAGGTIQLVDSGLVKTVLAKTANKEIGDPAENFNMTVIAKISGLGFRQQDVIDVVVSKIKQVLSADKYLADEGKNTYTATYKTIDSAGGQGVLAVHFETTAAYKVDSNNLSKLLAGKNESEIKEILLSKPEVDTVKVEFWPKWLTYKAPRFNGKIYIETKLSQ